MLIKMAIRRSFEMGVGLLAIATLTLAGCLGSGGGGGGATTPAQPTGIVASVGDGQATVSWTASSGATSYNIYYAAASGVTTTSGTKAASVSSPHVIPNLVNDTPYYFVVTALNAAGESTVSSEVTTTPVAVPAKPSGIVASGGDGQVTVSWTASTGATSYNVYYATASGVTTTSGIKVTSASNPAVITGLINNTPYYFVVTTVNAAGESSVSSEKTATPAATPQAPGSPTGVTVTSTAAGQATVSWGSVTGATSYNVYYLIGTTSTTTATVLSTGTKITSSSPAVINGLTSTSTYCFNVTAVNGGGESGAQTKPKTVTVQ